VVRHLASTPLQWAATWA